MNQIQKISQDLICQKLKLQMGLDPRIDVDPAQLHAMWSQLQREHNLNNCASNTMVTQHSKAA